MKNKTTMAALLLAAVMVTPSFGGELYKFWWENDQEFNQRVSQAKVSQVKVSQVKVSQAKVSQVKVSQATTIAPTPYFRMSHDDFEGENVFTTKLYPEDADGYELLISNTDPNKNSQAPYLYLSLRKKYFTYGKIVGTGRSGVVMGGGVMRWFTPNDFRFKTDVMNSPSDLSNATWVATEDVTALLNGKKLVVRFMKGNSLTEKSFSLENEAVAQTLAMLEENK